MNSQTQLSPRWLFALLLLTAALTGYARFILGYPICGTDEQNYLNIFDWLDRGGSWPISGPGYASLILELRRWTGFDTREVMTTVAALNSIVVLPLGLWLFYRIILDDSLAPWWCLSFLFPASYFLGPWLEGRPQQFGMLLTATGAWLAYRDLRDRGKCGFAFFLVWAICFGYHALSFVVLSALAFGFWARRFIQSRSTYRTFAALSLGLIACLGMGVLWYPLIWFDIRTNHIRGLDVGIFFGALLAVSGIVLGVLHGLRGLAASVALARHARVRFASPLVPWLAAGIAGLALVWQYAWLGSIYRDVEFAKILWYQAGNLLLAAFFLTGLWRWNREPLPQLEFFVESCLILMALGALFLLLTPWLRDHNWTLRVISYWIWYAAPLAVWGWLSLKSPWRWGLLSACIPLLVGGLHHVLYAPTWTCQPDHFP